MHADDEIYRILTRLGVGDEFAAHRRGALGLRLLDTDMRVLAELKRSPEPSANGYPQMNMFDQPELEAMMRANLKRYPHVVLRGDVEVTSVTQNRPGRVRVSFLDRVRGGEQSVEAAMCWAATAPTAWCVRRSAPTCTGCPSSRTGWSSTSTPTWNSTSGKAATSCAVSSVPALTCASERRGYRWEFRLLDGETAADYQTIEHIEPLIKPWLGGTPADQLRLVRVTAYTFRAQVASRWRERNVFVLGDAAHLTPPFVGQGMAAGLRDALNLSWKVAGVLGKSLPESVLDTYEQERKAHAAAMILMAVSVGAAMTGGGRVGDVVRKVVFPRLAHLRLPGTRTSAADGVAPGLHKSALVVKSRTPGSWPERFAPTRFCAMVCASTRSSGTGSRWSPRLR